jgi:hypothetical protein
VSVLREYSDNLRLNLKQHAEALANRAPLKLLFPAWMITLGFLILILTPAAMEISTFREENDIGNLKLEAKQAIDEANAGMAGAVNAAPAPAPAEESP